MRVFSIARRPVPLIFCAAILFDAAAAYVPSMGPGLGKDLASHTRPSRLATNASPRTRVASLATSLRASTPATLLEKDPQRGTGMFRGGGQAVVIECEEIRACPADGKAIVFFSGAGDLRVHDHAGLAAAASAGAVRGLFVFDTDLLRLSSDRSVRVLASAVEDLRSSLAALGVPLDVRVGDMEVEVRNAVQALGGTHVYAHHGPEDSAQRGMEKLEKAMTGSRVPMVQWNTGLRKTLRLRSDDYADYLKSREEAGATAVAEIQSEAALQQRLAKQGGEGAEGEGEISADAIVALLSRGRGEQLAAQMAARGKWRNIGATDEAGENLALTLWAEYLAGGEKKMAEARLVPDGALGLEHVALDSIMARYSPGEAFNRVFSELLALGCLSPRRVLATATTGGLPLDGGFLERRSSEGQAREAVEAREWHRVLGEVDLQGNPLRDDSRHLTFRYWRWRGHLLRYAEGDGAGQAVTLIHGFGASSHQWDRAFELLNDGHKVFALDLLGFGHSEKPQLTYTQYLWEDMVEDFILEVVGEPSFLAGNSIGGFTALSAAANLGNVFCPGLILCNSAGRMVPMDVYEQEMLERGGVTLKQKMLTTGLPQKASPSEALLTLFGKGVIKLLQPQVPKVLPWLYVQKPENADQKLEDNILRDSNDPGGFSVIASGAKLPPPRTKNELLADYVGPLLVTQGLNDPLGGGISKTRFYLYPEVHPNPEQVTLIPLQSGHCPHHETPEEVCAAIRDFVAGVNAGSQPKSTPEALALALSLKQ